MSRADFVNGLLTACSSFGDNNFQRLGALATTSFIGAAEPAPRQKLTRAELDKIPFATIALSFSGRQRTFLVPLADNGGYLNYLGSGGRGLVMMGGAVTGTQALGHDLEAVRHQPDDPVAYPTPVADWPG